MAYDDFIEATLAGGTARQVLGTATSCNYFDVLSEHPAQGRGFVDSDCAAPGQTAVVVVSNDLWRGSFAADPSLVGKRITLNRTAYTVVGIAPPGFTGTEPIASAFWVPITMQRTLEPGLDRLADDNLSWLALLGRTRPGVAMQQVHADLDVIAGRLDQRHRGRTTSLSIGRATFFSSPEEREFLIPVASVVLAAFALVLLIACANVANLLLARASVRNKEIALRLSIGASRLRLVRQLLTESLLLALAGGLLGSLIAFWSSRAIMRLVMSHLPHDLLTGVTLNVAPDTRVLAFALLLTLLTGVAFGLIPALQSSRLDLNTAMKGDGTFCVSGKTGGRFLLNALVGAQVAVCMVLLLAAGLLLRGLYYAQTVDPGFTEKNVAEMFLNLRAQGYDEHRATAFIGRLLEHIRALPGVVEVAQAECAPLSHDFSADHFTIPGRADKVVIEYNHVSPNYFSLVSIPIVRGRGFTDAEAREPSGVIVTESTAQRLWPGEDPLEKTLRGSTGGDYSVIGVAKDAQVSHLGSSIPATSTSLPGHKTTPGAILVRYATGFKDISSGIRQAARSLDPDLSVDVIKLEDNLEVWRAPSRIVAALSGALGALALLLASIGVYGMVSYSVSRCVREIGIRMAVGANGADVVSLVLRRAMRPVLIGVLAGVALCAVVSQVLSSMLFGLSPHDPIAFICVPVFLVAVALIASCIPARRAMRVDPMIALRCE